MIVSLLRLVRPWLPEPAVRMARRLIREYRWFRYPFLSEPRRALRSRRLDASNARYFRRIRAEHASGLDAFLRPYAAKPVPRTVWVFWAQGEAAMPPVARACIRRMREMAGGYEVRVLDLETARDCVDVDDVDHVRAQSIVVYSDILRLRLLERHGGVWIDSTVWLHAPLLDWLPLLSQQGLFMFRRPQPDHVIDPWFIAATAGHPVIAAWQHSLAHSAQTSGRAKWPYFQVTYCLQDVLDRDAGLRDMLADAGGLVTPPTHVLMSALEGRSPEGMMVDLLRTGLPVSKLNHRTKIARDVLVSRILAMEAAARE